MTVGITQVSGWSKDGKPIRVRVALANYLQHNGAPHYVMADWTEQFGPKPGQLPNNDGDCKYQRTFPIAGAGG
jgi:hypothetical protein